MGTNERWISGIGGVALLLYGLKRGDLRGLALGLLGGGLLYRGAAGQCMLYRSLGIDTSEGVKLPFVGLRRSIRMEQSIVIQRPADDLYRYWRNFSNLPKVMRHLESVVTTNEKLSHWIARGPADTRIEWGAEIINDKPGELIAWRSLRDSDIGNAGSVSFKPAGAGTEVRVNLQFEAPAGKLGLAIAKLLGEEPELQIEEDLRRFKQAMEQSRFTL